MAANEVCRLHVYNRSAFAYESYPLARGVPLPPGAFPDPGVLGIVGPDGSALPVQTRVLQRRKDGSVEWALFEFVMDVPPDTDVTASVGEGVERPAPRKPVEILREGSRLTLTNGFVTLALSSEPGPFIRSLSVGSRTVIEDGSQSEIVLADPNGKLFRAAPLGYKLEAEPGGPVRSTLRLEGKHRARDDTEMLDFAIRFTLWADRSDLLIAHTFVNREPSPTGIRIAGMELVLDTGQDPAAVKVVHQDHHGRKYFSRMVEVRENTELAATSEPDILRYAAKVKPYENGDVLLRDPQSLEPDLSIYPYYMRPGASAFRAELQIAALQSVKPYVGWRSDALTIIPCIKRMAALHPKSLAFDESTLTIGIWPRWAGPLTIRQGVSKTHEICLALADEPLSNEAVEERAVRFELNWDPVEVGFDPGYPAKCRVLDQHLVLPYDPARYPRLEERFRTCAGVGSPGAGPHYLSMGGQGMFHYGDSGGAGGFHNNEHDGAVLTPIKEYLRTGHVACWERARECAQHYMEVDHCAFSTDPLQHGALIPHCQNHHEGSAYPSHQWMEGLIAYYYLSGDERVRAVALAQAEHTLYWIEHMPEIVTADGREAGLPMTNLSATYKLTGDERFREGACRVVEGFVRKYMQPDGSLRYPHQGSRDFMMTNYADCSTMHGLWRLYEVTGDEELRALLIKALDGHCVPENMDPRDTRSMDFESPAHYYHLTGDESIFERLQDRTEMLLRGAGRAHLRLKWLALLVETGRLQDAP